MSGFITDTEATSIARKILSQEEYTDFVQRKEMFRHLERCVANNTPSPHCRHTDHEKNLAWCRLGLRIEGDAFENYLQTIIEHYEAAKAISTTNQGEAR